MAYEIELKAWADDAPGVEKRLNEIACYQFSYIKNDVYWRSEDAAAFPSGLRLREEIHVGPDRKESRELLLTYKAKELRRGIEINEEKEFRIAPPSKPSAPPSNPSTPPFTPKEDGAEELVRGDFEFLLRRLRFTPGLSKTKTGKRWSYLSPAECEDESALEISAELSVVTGLGCFLELEILAAADTPAKVAQAERALRRLLELSGIPPNRIESRYYSELLASSSRSPPAVAALIPSEGTTQQAK